MRGQIFYKSFLLSLFILMPLPAPAYASVGDFLFKWSSGYSFHYPSGIAVDGNGNVYVADTNNNRIQVFSNTGAFIRKWGGPGQEDGQLRYPAAIAVDRKGNVYVTDTYNHRIQVFSNTGAFIKKWGTYGSDDGQLYLPSGIAVDGNENVYVADTHNHRIQVFSSTGALKKWGGYGFDDGQFNYPSGIAVDGNGNVYVADTNNSRVQVFTSRGTFLRKWGSPGPGDGQFKHPSGIAIDGNGNVYVSDTDKHKIQVFSSTGTFIRSWGRLGSEDGQFNYPSNIAIDGSGNIYVADTHNHRIQVFSDTETFLRKWGTTGSGDDQLNYPSGIATDGSGNVYVADTHNHRIQVFSSTGVFLKKWGDLGSGDAQFNYPSGIAVDGNGNVYVADTYNHRIQVFSSAGTFIRKWGGLGSGNGQFYYPSGIAVDGRGSLHVVDTYNHRIQVFSSTGTFIRKWGTYGNNDGQFNHPHGIAISENGIVYVADTYNHRIQIFTNTGTFLNKWESYGSGDDQFNYPSGIAVGEGGSIYVADTYNHRVQVFSNSGTFIRKWGAYGNNDGWFSFPISLTLDRCGSVAYVADTYKHTIQVFAEAGMPVVTNMTPSNMKEGVWLVSDIRATLNPSGGCGAVRTWYRLNGGSTKEYTAAFTISAEGTNTLEYWSTSAGYEEEHKTSVIPIDKTPPLSEAKLSGTSGNNGWYFSDVQVAFSATDSVSGVEKMEYSLDGTSWNPYDSPFIIETDGITNIYYRSMDKAGNHEPSKTRIMIDKILPVITGSITTPPNEKGWYKTNPVVHFTANDSISGIDTVTPDITIFAEGANQSVTGTATDKTGNSASVFVSGINIDKTPPQITIMRPSSEGEYILNQTIAANGIANDALSGVSSVTGTVPNGRNISTGTVGAKGFTIIAIDNAGNQATQTITYYVRYSYSGILQPINPDGSSLFKLGSTIPVKFRLADYNRNYVSTGVAKLSVSKISDTVAGDEIETISTAAPTTGNTFKYDSKSNEYIFNLGTKALSPGTWQIMVSLDDGTSRYATISLK